MATAAKRQEDDLPDDELASLVRETEPIVFSARDWEWFLTEWDNPGKPRPRLEEAVRRYLSGQQPAIG